MCLCVYVCEYVYVWGGGGLGRYVCGCICVYVCRSEPTWQYHSDSISNDLLNLRISLRTNLYVCTYVCMYVCVYVCMYACMYLCMYVIYVCMYAYMYVQLYMYVSTHTCKHACVYVWNFACVYLAIYVYEQYQICLFQCVRVCTMWTTLEIHEAFKLIFIYGKTEKVSSKQCLNLAYWYTICECRVSSFKWSQQTTISPNWLSTGCVKLNIGLRVWPVPLFQKLHVNGWL